jgi:hypothetical protein
VVWYPGRWQQKSGRGGCVGCQDTVVFMNIVCKNKDCVWCHMLEFVFFFVPNKWLKWFDSVLHNKIIYVFVSMLTCVSYEMYAIMSYNIDGMVYSMVTYKPSIYHTVSYGTILYYQFKIYSFSKKGCLHLQRSCSRLRDFLCKQVMTQTKMQSWSFLPV